MENNYNYTYKNNDNERNSHRNRKNNIPREELIKQLENAAEQMADLLLEGYQLELSTSRSGFQIYKMLKSYQVVYRDYDAEREKEKRNGGR